METETRALIDEFRTDMAAGFAGVSARFATIDATLVSMNATSVSMNATLVSMNATLARHVRWFELLHVQHVAFRTDVHHRLGALDTEMGALKGEMSGTRSELHRFRDWTGGQFVEVKSSLNELTRRFEAARSNGLEFLLILSVPKDMAEQRVWTTRSAMVCHQSRR